MLTTCWKWHKLGLMDVWGYGCDAQLNEQIGNTQKQSHMGFKLAGVSRTYNITANHMC
jgi:hypothetical protein